jgi:hypothetical protein
MGTMKLFVNGFAGADGEAGEVPVDALRMIIAAHKTLNPQAGDMSLVEAGALLTAAEAEPQLIGDAEDNEDALVECETALARVGILTERDYEPSDGVELQPDEDEVRPAGPTYLSCQLALVALKQCAGNPLNAYAMLLEQRKIVGSGLAPVNGDAARVLADTFDITSP